jgi:hypothetical protein
METFVALPDDLKLAIAGVVLWAVAQFFRWLVAQFPWLDFLQGYAEPLAYALSAILIAALENAIHDAYSSIGILALRLIVEILLAVGVGRTLTGAKRALFG